MSRPASARALIAAAARSGAGKTSLTAHVVHDGTAVPDALIDVIKIKLADQFKVFHTTLQLETKPCEHTEDGCNFIDPRSPVVAQ